MSKSKKITERRKHDRIKPKDCSVVVKSTFGEVIDISIGGVAFSYIDREGSVRETEGIGLLFGEDDLFLDELPIRILSDCAISEGVSVIRRCSASFGKLTSKQISLLEHLIKANINDDSDDEFSA